MKKLLFVCLLVFAGCMSSKEVMDHNENSLKSPEYVGEIKGKKIYHCRIYVKNGGEHTLQHVYFVDDTITINTPRHKSNSDVSVMINGAQYAPLNKAEIHGDVPEVNIMDHY